MTKYDDDWYRLQGHLNAIEIILLSDIYNFAKTQRDPFQWIQAFIEAIRQTSKTLIPDAMDEEAGAKLKRETRASLDAFLESLVRHAGPLKGESGTR